MNELLFGKIRECPTLPSLPTIAVEVLELAQREEVDIAEIARLISKDPALVSKILRTVNSSFYGRSQSISQVSQALVILGLQSVKTLVLGFALVATLQPGKAKGFRHVNYWKRSIYAATAAKTLASRTQTVQTEECFLGGLLQDLGMLVLDMVAHDEYEAVNEQAATHRELVAAEQAALGTTHAEVTGFLADQWKLPPVLAEPLRHHHDPDGIAEPTLRRLSEVAYCGGLCADVFVDENPGLAIEAARRCCAERFRMSEADCDAMLADVGNRAREIAPLFEVKLGKAADFEQILKRATEVMAELAVKSQQEAAKGEQQGLRVGAGQGGAGASAAAASSSSAGGSSAGHGSATTDGLTGLANRAQFDRFLSDRYAEAGGGGRRAVSLLLVDVDQLKLVNDKFGRIAGDHVLKSIGHLLRSAARSADLAARYGGEELALVLPGTGRATAAAIAESVRRAVAAKQVAFEAMKFNVTVSVGVATFDAESPLKQPPHLLKAAELAVFAAKKGGRNCVKVFSLPGSNAPAAAAAAAASATCTAAPAATPAPEAAPAAAPVPLASEPAPAMAEAKAPAA